MATTRQDIVRSSLPYALPAAGILFLSFMLWCYWTTLGEMAQRWADDPQYSHGYLVPVFSLALLWLRRGQVRGLTLQPNWAGLVLVGAALGLRLAGTYFYFSWLDYISLLPCLAGGCLLAGGLPVLRWSWPAIAFLIFMIPLPHSCSVALAGPMQTFATQASVFVLQVLGQPALAEGNIILLNEVELGIVEACSGLRMLVVFFALSTAVGFLIKKPLWEKILVGGSALPIALLANVLRITLTGLLYEMVGTETAGPLFHDLAGWLMMPLALLLLGLELVLLKRLFQDPRNSLGAAPLSTSRPWWQFPYRIYRRQPGSPTPPGAVPRKRTLVRR